ncbi:MAG: Eco57I restriction-modification methylase domain-containing protein [Promethearchaeota archaeon]
MEFNGARARVEKIPEIFVFRILIFSLFSKFLNGEPDPLVNGLMLFKEMDGGNIKKAIAIIEKKIDEIINFYCQDTFFVNTSIDPTFNMFLNHDLENLEQYLFLLLKILGIPLQDEILEQLRFHSSEKYPPPITRIVDNAVSLDIDILGKYYEQFIVKKRKRTGIYYTPEIIVSLMINDAFHDLIDNYQQEIQHAISANPKNNTLNMKDYRQLRLNFLLHEKILKIKILDPSCGTGWFLVKSIIALWSVNDFIKQQLARIMSDGKQPNKDPMLKEMFNRHVALSAFLNRPEKIIAHILLDQVRGIDLDKTALEITKINLKLTCIKLLKSKLNRTFIEIIENLLNLALINGNAIVGMDNDELEQVYSRRDDKRIIQSLLKLKQKLSDPNVELDREYLDKLRGLVKEKRSFDKTYIKEFKEICKKHGFLGEIMKQLPVIPAINFHDMFFDENGGLLSDEESGFDLIIGNPPYVSYKKHLLIHDRNYLEKRYTIFNGQADLSYYFFELHYKLLKKNGISSQITSRYFMQAAHGKKLRKLLAKQQILKIVDFNNYKVFKNLGIHPVIFVFKKNPVIFSQDHEIKIIKINDGRGNFHHFKLTLANYFKIHDDRFFLNDNTNLFFDLILVLVHLKLGDVEKVKQSLLGESSWIFLSSKDLEIMEKLWQGIPLTNLGRCISGSETGLDEAFVNHVIKIKDRFFGKIDEKLYPLESRCIHPWIKNGDISRYHHQVSRYCIYIPPELDENDFKKQFPNTFNFLIHFKEKLMKRDGGKIRVPWYVWRRPKNIKNLEKSPKLICPYKAVRPRFSIDVDKNYSSYDVTLFIPSNDEIDIKYILGFLNSSIARWFYLKHLKKMGKIFEFYPEPVSRIFIPKPKEPHYNRIINKVDEILGLLKNEGKNYNQSALEKLIREIDEIFHDVLNLKPAEKNLIEKENC